MGAVLLDGKGLSREIEDDLKNRVEKLNNEGIEPHLAVILVGDDPASHVYVRNKENACKRTGIKSTKIILPASTSEKEVLDLIEEMNEDDDIHGILVQSPAPEGVDELAIASSILPQKDVDGFNPVNLGKLVQGRVGGLMPCTPSGVMRMLKSSGVKTRGARAVVLGRSRIVGMPMALMLAQPGCDASVTIVHSKTDGIASICNQADILIAAVGRPHMVEKEWVKQGAFVVDVGISRVEGGLAGDVSPEVSEVAGWITPVPGGVGPMTIAMLMENTLRAAEM